MHPDLSLSLCCSWHFCTTGTKNTVFANWRPSILAFCGICMKGSGRGRFDHHQSTGVSNAWGKEEAGPGNQKCCEFTKNCKLGLSRSCRAQVPKCLKCPIFFSRLIFILDIFSGHLYFLAHLYCLHWLHGLHCLHCFQRQKAGLGVWMEWMYWIPYKCVKCDKLLLLILDLQCLKWYWRDNIKQKPQTAIRKNEAFYKGQFQDFELFL